MSEVAETELRVLLDVATSRDAIMARAVLSRAGIEAFVCADVDQLIDEFRRGAGALLVAEELLVTAAFSRLMRLLAKQEPWSDVPLLVLARRGADSLEIGTVMDGLPSVTVIERPVRVASLVSALRSSLRARKRQYELRALLAGLHDADQRKTEFLATLAHELRNPLAPLSAALELLSVPQVQNGERKNYYEMMRRQVDHMTRLVDDLMEVSRITRGKVELQLVPLLLASVLDDAIELSRPWFEAAGHTLAVDLPPDMLFVRGDRVRLTQVFSNLLNNAAKYTSSGGRIALRARRDRRDAVIEVSDTGAGLAPHMLRPIFDMFVQVSDTAKVAQGGLGIGLTLVKSLVELHGGSVTARSAGLEQGSTFTVRLPLAQDADVQTRAPVSSAELIKAAHERSVLVVDDNRDAADSLGALLRMMGANVYVAYDAREALRLTETCVIDNAVLDIGMPETDGCALARGLRERPETAHMTLIALTGWGQENDRERVREAGFDHHMLKPADPKELLRLLAPRQGYSRR
jgi:signal transduction histidine kinase/ActR/RegA family two-component response regulator